MTWFYELKHTTLELKDDGFVWFISKPGASHDGEYSREPLATFKALGDGQPILVYADIRQLGSVTSESRQIGASVEFAGAVKASAVLIGCPISRVIVDFFTWISRPPYPTRVFTEQAEALAWLATHLN